MSVTKFLFSQSRLGAIDGYLLENGQLSVTVLSLGGIIQKFFYHRKDIVCGFDDADSYLDSGCYYGAIIGRCCNRMKQLKIDGKSFSLTQNEKGTNHLHGGAVGFDKKIWNVQTGKDMLLFTHRSQDGEEGYPGTLDVRITYTLHENELRLHYEAVSDRDTAVNLTNHSYFNLNGIGGTVLNHKLYIPAYHISECDELHIPTGRHLPCWGTPLDFNIPKPIGQDIEKPHPQLTPWGGYDNNYILRKSERLSLGARIEGEEIAMEVLTDLPCLQLYTSNDSHKKTMKYGAAQIRHRAFCIETQLEPNSMNFDGNILRMGEHYEATTIFRLSGITAERI